MTTPGQKEALTLFGQHLPSLSTQTPTEEAGEAGDARTKEDGRPRKWPKLEGKGGSQPSRATKGNRGWNNSWGNWDDDHQAKLTDQVSGEEVRNLLALVTRLSLRQEDDLAATRADNAFLFYLETRTTGTYRPIPSFAGHFFAIAQQWQKLRDETPEKHKEAYLNRRRVGSRSRARARAGRTPSGRRSSTRVAPPSPMPRSWTAWLDS